MQLDERKKRILAAIIREYVRTAEPVGSRAIARQADVGVSAATVRNEMADLEEMGFLDKPHTSAGRVPSEQGFRYYVDWMMEKEELGEAERAFLGRILKEKVGDLQDLIEKTGAALSNLTNYASVIVSPGIQGDSFRKMELVYLEPGKALLVLVSDKGTILHRKLDIAESITPEDLEQVTIAFNGRLQGVRIKDISHSVLRSLRSELARRRQILDVALEAVDDLLEATGKERVTVSGTLNILNEPEFKDLMKLRRILGILEDEGIIKQLLEDRNLTEVRIKIGRENKMDEIKELSLVFSTYDLGGGVVGRIGLLGPVRMNYPRAVGSVEAVRDAIQEVINDLFR